MLIRSFIVKRNYNLRLIVLILNGVKPELDFKLTHYPKKNCLWPATSGRLTRRGWSELRIAGFNSVNLLAGSLNVVNNRTKVCCH